MSIFKKNKDTDLSKTKREMYENIFNVYKFDDKYYYNITKKVTIDTNNISPDVFEYYTVQSKLPWTTISHIIYGTQHLWWLILATNKINNPLNLPVPGLVLKIIKPDYVDTILNEIQTQA